MKNSINNDADVLLVPFMDALSGITDKALLSKLNPTQHRPQHIRELFNALVITASKSINTDKDTRKQFRQEWFDALQEDVEQRYITFEYALQKALPEWRSTVMRIADKYCKNMSLDRSRMLQRTLTVTQPINTSHPLHHSLKKSLPVSKLRWLGRQDVIKVNQMLYAQALSVSEADDKRLCYKLVEDITALPSECFFTLYDCHQSLSSRFEMLPERLSSLLAKKEDYPHQETIEILINRYPDIFSSSLNRFYYRLHEYIKAVRHEWNITLTKSAKEYADALNVDHILALVGNERQPRLTPVYNYWLTHVAKPLLSDEAWSWSDNAILSTTAGTIKSKARHLLDLHYEALDRDLDRKLQIQREARKTAFDNFPFEPEYSGENWLNVRIMHIDYTLEQDKLLQTITTSNNETLYIFWPKSAVGLRQFQIIDCCVVPDKENHLWIQQGSIVIKT